jgi:lactam utilization protein B
VLASVSSVNIACGAHAGDADTMRRTIDAAAARASPSVHTPATRIATASDAAS